MRGAVAELRKKVTRQGLHLVHGGLPLGQHGGSTMTFTKRKNTCRSQPQCLVTRAAGKQPLERAGGERQSVGWHFSGASPLTPSSLSLSLLVFALNRLLSTVCPQLFALNCLPSTVCPQPRCTLAWKRTLPRPNSSYVGSSVWTLQP